MFRDALIAYRQSLSERAVSRYDVMAVFLPLLVLLSAEFLLFYASRDANIAGTTDVVLLHALNIAICIIVPIVLKLDNSIYQAYSLISVLRILSIGMPNFGGITLDWMILVYVAMMPVIWFALMDERFSFTMEPGEFPFRKLGKEMSIYLRSLTDSVSQITVGVVGGSILGLIGFLFIGMPETIPGLNVGDLIKAALVLVLVVALVEELLFRRMLLRRVARRFGPAMAVMVTAFIFAIMHSGYVSLPIMAFMFLAGLLFGTVYTLTGRLAIVVPMHGMMLLTMTALYPFIF